MSPLLRDSCLALGCFLIGVPELLVHGGWNLPVVAALLAMSLPVVVQSRWPATVFAILAVFAALQWVADVRVLSDLSLLVVLTTLVIQRRTREVAAAVVVLEVGVILAVTRWSDHSLLLAVLINIAIAASVLLGVYLREHGSYVQQVTERAARLERDRHRQAQLAAAAERARIAGQMHDVLGHHLAVMIALADGAAAAQRAGQDPAEALRQLSATGRQALSETRSLVGVLAQDAAVTALPATVDQLAGPVRLAGIPVRVRVVGTPFELGPGAEQAARLAVQEALTNTLKHATRPADAEVVIDYASSGLELRITDHGARAPARSIHGSGLTGMADRVRGHGGQLRAGPCGNGWSINICLPRATDANTPAEQQDPSC